jgi:hypothetical protein
MRSKHISEALELDMTRYWTPTRASYFDHVSKARIIDVVVNAVSPKAAANLQKMKKGDAAELRLAQVKWVPEILTSQTLPVVNHFDPDDADDGDTGDSSQGDGNCVDCLEIATVDGYKRLREQLQLTAQDNEATTYVADAGAVITTDVSYGLEVRRETAGEPH